VGEVTASEDAALGLSGVAHLEQRMQDLERYCEQALEALRMCTMQPPEGPAKDQQGIARHPQACPNKKPKQQKNNSNKDAAGMPNVVCINIFARRCRHPH